MDYKEMWIRLQKEMSDLESKDVSSVDPSVVLSYMSFLEQLCDSEHKS